MSRCSARSRCRKTALPGCRSGQAGCEKSRAASRCGRSRMTHRRPRFSHRYRAARRLPARPRHRPRRLSARLSGHLRDRVTVDDGRAIKVPGGRSPTDAGRAVHQGLALHRAHVSPHRVLHPMQRVGPKGGGASSGSAGTRRSTTIAARLERSRRARVRRRSCPTAMPARWAWCRASRWIGASSTGSARRCSTARSARPPAATGLKCDPSAPRSACDVEPSPRAA